MSELDVNWMEKKRSSDMLVIKRLLALLVVIMVIILILVIVLLYPQYKFYDLLWKELTNPYYMYGVWIL